MMRKDRPMTGRACYDHLGGRLGAALFQLLVEKGWIRLEEGKATVYVVTEEGTKALTALGLTLGPTVEG